MKRVQKEKLTKQKSRIRFLREIAAIRKLSHPCIVRYLDASTTNENPYLVMEWAPLGSLDQHVKTLFKGDAWRTLRMARDISSALQVAHEKKIIHRDVKPKNILLRDLDHPILADFGISHDSDDTSVTSDGEHVGPKDFAPPEYFEGHYQPTPAFDIYCLGGVIYYALSGGILLRRNDHSSKEFNLRRLFNRPEFDAINKLLAKMHANNIRQRSQSMNEVIQEIDVTIGLLFGGRPRTPGICISCGRAKYDYIGNLLDKNARNLILEIVENNNAASDIFQTGVWKCPSCKNIQLYDLESILELPDEKSALDELELLAAETVGTQDQERSDRLARLSRALNKGA